MPQYEFACDRCDNEETVARPMCESHIGKRCGVCGNIMRRVYGATIHGTRDSFGIRNAFTDSETGKEITTWKEWEQAGYKPIKDAKVSDKVRTLAKEKSEKVKGRLQI